MSGPEDARTFFAASYAVGEGEDGGEMMVQIDPDLLLSPEVTGFMISEWMKHLAAAHVQAGHAEAPDAALRTILGTCLGQLTEGDDDAPRPN